MATTLLDKCHLQLKAKVYERLTGASACLTTDGWSNMNEEFDINYIALSHTCRLYLKAIQTGQKGQDHLFIVKDIESIFSINKKTAFAKSVTDNISAIKIAWKVLNDKFQSFPELYLSRPTSACQGHFPCIEDNESRQH